MSKSNRVMRPNLVRYGTCIAAILLGMGAALNASAEDAKEIIVTGTRTTGLKAVDSAAPIQLVDSASLKRVAQTDLSQALAQTVPSFTVQAFGGDMANQTLSARLRGLSPNNTLVLVNGKRRHGTSNLAVLSGPYQGGASADFSFLPVGSIDHVEVLTDGAAAQYGTDAIAGVVNVILKKSTSGGSIALSGGEYFDGGGKTGELTANIGIAPTPNSYLNVTYFSKYHGYSDRGAADPRAYGGNDAGSYIGGAYDTSIAGFPFVNHISGDAAQNLNVLAYNFGYKLNDTWDIYSFGTYGKKKASSYENWRVPARLPAMYPKGFNPHESANETDSAFTIGATGSFLTWDVDLASSYGKDDMQITNFGGGNVSLYNDKGYTPSFFYIGAFIGQQLTNNIDFSKEFEVGMAGPMNVAFGVEQRSETYQIKPGDAASRYKEGSQAFPGFALSDAGKHDRTSEAIYVDVAVTPISDLSVDAALRYEHYSDFGDTTVGKITARYDFSPAFALRGTLSTGFRAPTMAESFYSATNVSPTSAFVQLPPNKAAAKLLGISGLQPEESTNMSFGVVLHPLPTMTLTIDAYQIDIDDRIIGSGSVYGTGSPSGNNIPEVVAAILANGNVLDPTVSQTGVNLFLNGANTSTKGVDVVLSYPTDFGTFGKVDWSLSGSYNKTEVKSFIDASSLASIKASDLFDPSVAALIEKQSPDFRLILGALWSVGNFTVNLKESVYGETSSTGEAYSPVCGGSYFCNSTIPITVITDLDVTYKLSKSVKLSVGANNLFNKYPKKINPALLKSWADNNDNSSVGQYPSYSPFGFNGGYYYTKLVYSF